MTYPGEEIIQLVIIVMCAKYFDQGLFEFFGSQQTSLSLWFLWCVELEVCGINGSFWSGGWLVVLEPVQELLQMRKLQALLYPDTIIPLETGIKVFDDYL